MDRDDEDRAAWVDACAEGGEVGMHRFVERRVLGFGVKLGLVLAAWNTLVGGTFLNYDGRRLLFEDMYYFMGAAVLSGLAAMLEWQYLERKFGQLVRVRSDQTRRR